MIPENLSSFERYKVITWKFLFAVYEGKRANTALKLKHTAFFRIQKSKNVTFAIRRFQKYIN